MAPSRKSLGFAAGSVLSDRQLWAIGLVCAEWSMIEFHMRTFADALTADGSAEREEYHSMLVFRQRLRLVKSWIEAAIMEPWRGDLVRMFNRIGEIAQERDNIVHGVWGGPKFGVPYDRTNLPEASSVTNLRGKPHFKWRLDYSGIMAVVRKIDALNTELLQFQIDASGGVPFTTLSALQRISRKQNPNP